MSCLPCLSPCFASEVAVEAHRKDEPAYEHRANAEQPYRPMKTGSRGNPNHGQPPWNFEQKVSKLKGGDGDVEGVCLDFGDCDSAAHQKADWGNGVLAGDMLKVQSSMTYSEDEDEEAGGAHELGAKCAKSNAKSE